MISFELQDPLPSGKIKIGLLKEVFSIMTRELFEIVFEMFGFDSVKNNK